MVVDGADAKPSLDLFLSIGLDKRTAENAIVNAKFPSNLTAVIKEAGVVDGCNKNIGDLLYRTGPHSREVVPEAFVVPSLVNSVLGDKYQFGRLDSPNYHGAYLNNTHD